MRTSWFAAPAALMPLAAALPADASLVNQIPSCYAASRYRFASAPPRHLLYVLIDQAGRLSPALRKSVLDNINHALGPATKFVIAQFSRITNKHYLRVLYTGIIESPMSSAERDNVPVNSLGGFNSCMRGQAQYALHMADTAAERALQSASGAANQPNDILFALKTVAPVIAQDGAAKKVLFLVTDGFENSSFANFSAGIADPGHMLQQVRAQGLLANFGGARVFVLGAGISPRTVAGPSFLRQAGAAGSRVRRSGRR